MDGVDRAGGRVQEIVRPADLRSPSSRIDFNIKLDPGYPWLRNVLVFPVAPLIFGAPRGAIGRCVVRVQDVRVVERV